MVAILLLLACGRTWGQWKPAGNNISTRWVSQVVYDCPLDEYPRPILQRSEWKNLNGLWQYAVRERGASEMGEQDGDILVPFAVESSLSGVMRTVGKDNELWYRRLFTVPRHWREKRILLHFGAVDWFAEVYVNGMKAGSHKGGFVGFSFDITPYLDDGEEQRLELRVWDPTTEGYQPVGKQSSSPEGIWYTSVTGIWQTVWIEPVEKQHITSINTFCDIDSGCLSILAGTAVNEGVINVTLIDDGKVIGTQRAAAGRSVDFYLESPRLWDTATPFLYDLIVSIEEDGKVVDEVTSYAAMRKISTKRDSRGIVRIQLNNKDIFMFGPLDQGYWPDGLYTAPTDEALRFDIELARDLGFNMIRKHMKVEPARWYTWCDRMGMLVWQDMPSGDKSPQWQPRQYFSGDEITRSSESETEYKQEWKEIINALQPYPCVVVWVPFNEAWGQFKSPEIAEWTKSHDPTRLLNPASGGNHYPIGDMLDIHNYPAPDLFLYDGDRATVLGEYGGLGFPVEGHLWQTDGNWGYAEFRDAGGVTERYLEYTNMLQDLIPKGLSAAVYTQATDVEGEVNGLVTYDRKVIKVEKERLRHANRSVCHALDNNE